MEPIQQFQPTHRDVFIVRIWREGSAPEWQGWVQHTRSGESAGFRNLNELLAFIEMRATVADLTEPQGLR
ncbi:MAG: hypothetical protein RBT75_05780 [Anaerolineae bacterium]|jgi:hypothetical protein|nr:hypothetical protein [Anaerolineae bacterium]